MATSFVGNGQTIPSDSWDSDYTRFVRSALQSHIYSWIAVHAEVPIINNTYCTTVYILNYVLTLVVGTIMMERS